jgi:tRNA (guanine37-N1)-methyltransferase
MRIDVITLFPDFFESPLRASLLGKAIDSQTVAVETHDLRNWGIGVHRTVDDDPYGGGAGMVLRPEPLFEAIDATRGPHGHVALLSPRGAKLDQRKIEELSARPHLILVCGRYEGVDERVTQAVDEEISVGDYVLAGGEAAAVIVIEAVCRVVPGVVGNEESLRYESHTSGGLEYPQYTRPAEYRGMKVPDVLLSGNHAAVDEWRRGRAEQITKERRPDLT